MSSVTSPPNSRAAGALQTSPTAPAGDETHERLARALTAAVGSFATSSAIAARITATERAHAFQRMTAGFNERHEAMLRYTETLENNRGAVATAVAGTGSEPASTPVPRGSGGNAPDSSTGAMVSVKIPGLKRDVGLGDAVSKLTSVFGIVTCSACARRAEQLNKALVFRAPREK